MVESIIKIKKVKLKDISKSYLDTINHKNTKRFIEYAKLKTKKIKRIDLENYLKNIPENETLYGIFENNIHKANFKLTIKKNKIYIGFLVFTKFQGMGLIKKSFQKILKLKEFKNIENNRLYLGVDRKNQNAISLYTNLGFKKLNSSHKFMYFKFKK